MAPSTPPPPKRRRFGAFKMALTSSVGMSATTTLRRALPTSAVTRALFLAGIFRLGLGRRIDGAVRSDSIKMRRQEPACRLSPALMQRLEKPVIVVQAAAGIGPFGKLIEHDPMQPQAPGS